MSESGKRRRPRVVVVGLGQFGTELATRLAEEADVLALDHDEKLVNSIADRVQSARILDACDTDSLRTVVDDTFDEGVVAVGDDLASSVLVALHLKQLGVKRIRAKAISTDHAQILSAIGVDEVVFPEVDAARHLASRIVNPGLVDFVPLARGYRVMSVEPPKSFVGHTLRELDLRHHTGLLVLGVQEKSGRYVRFLPGPDHRISANEALVVIGHEDHLARVHEMERITRYLKKDPTTPPSGTTPAPDLPTGEPDAADKARKPEPDPDGRASADNSPSDRD